MVLEEFLVYSQVKRNSFYFILNFKHNDIYKYIYTRKQYMILLQILYIYIYTQICVRVFVDNHRLLIVVYFHIFYAYFS